MVTSYHVKDRYVVGVISDTHGVLRPPVIELLKGVNLIIHAGDIGKWQVLEALHAVAPTLAVRGNVDRGKWAFQLPETETVVLGQAMVYVLHDVHDLNVDPTTLGYHAVISGHSHRPSISRENGVLYLNPGSAGPKRFKLPTTLALLDVQGRSLDPKLVTLEV